MENGVKQNPVFNHAFILVQAQASTVTLTILCVEQHLIELGLIVIKGLSDFVYCLLISQVTIHEAAKIRGRKFTKKQVEAWSRPSETL